MTDIAIITNIPTPYREGLFRRLDERNDICLTVFYCEKNFKWRDWSIETKAYNANFLSGISHKDKVLNPTIIPKLVQNNYDCVIVGGYSTPTALLSELAAALTNTPLLIWIESHLRDELNKNASHMKRFFKRVFLGGVLRICDGYIVPGKASKEYVLYYGASSKDIFTAPTTCDIERFKARSSLTNTERVSLRERWGITEQQLILYVGRITPKKGLKTLLKAFRILRGERDDVGLVMVGSGPLEKKLTNKYDDNGIYWIGYQPDDRLPQIYGLADLFTCPSLGDQWAVVVNEAMASGLPIIATENVGSAHDLVNNGLNGWTIKADDVAALSTLLHQAFSSKGDIDLAAMGAQSRRIISKFSHERTVDGFIDAVNHVR